MSIPLHPILVQIGSFSLRWYGLMTACGFLAGILLAIHRAKKFNRTADDVSDLTIWCMLGAVLGARALYVIRFWKEQFADTPGEIFKIWHGGLVFLGGLAGGLLLFWLYCRRKKWPVIATANFFAPSLFLGQAFGRIGCLMNGCCHGFFYQGPLAVSYPEAGIPSSTFPLQACSALLALLGCGFLLLAEKKNWFHRQTALLYLILYSIGRFCLEFGRGDYPEWQKTWGLTPAQITCLWLLPLVLCSALLYRRHCRCQSLRSK